MVNTQAGLGSRMFIRFPIFLFSDSPSYLGYTLLIPSVCPSLWRIHHLPVTQLLRPTLPFFFCLPQFLLKSAIKIEWFFKYFLNSFTSLSLSPLPLSLSLSSSFRIFSSLKDREHFVHSLWNFTRHAVCHSHILTFFLSFSYRGLKLCLRCRQRWTDVAILVEETLLPVTWQRPGGEVTFAARVALTKYNYQKVGNPYSGAANCVNRRIGVLRLQKWRGVGRQSSPHVL